MCRANTISIINEKLYNYRINENSINSQTINDKRITCLGIYNLIINDLHKKKNLIKYATYSRAHFLISVIVCLLKSKDIDYKYYKIVNDNAREMVFNILFSNIVPIKFKLTILLCAINTYLFCKCVKKMSKRV
ncbi:MAG TPA: hypothetical protein DHV55_01645 [Clostridiaceae bacterium]|nr:hypothetical protein [Clostridiaceae bacterium]